MRTVIRLLLIAAGLSLCGCISPHQATATDVNPSRWERTAEIGFDNTDTLSLRDMYLFVRSNGRFVGDTIPIQIAFITPDSLRFEEQFVLRVPPTQTPAALIGEHEFLYRQRVQLARKGLYRIQITPSHPVRGIEAIGINIVKRK